MGLQVEWQWYKRYPSEVMAVQITEDNMRNLSQIVCAEVLEDEEESYLSLHLGTARYFGYKTDWIVKYTETICFIVSDEVFRQIYKEIEVSYK